MDVEDFLEIFFLSLPLAATFLRALARAVSRLLVLARVCVLNHVLNYSCAKGSFPDIHVCSLYKCVLTVVFT